MVKVNTAFLDGFRFLLALWVAIGHFYKYVGGEELIDIPIISSVLIANGAAVDGFMIITGFLMAYHYILREQKEPFEQVDTMNKFWLRRIFRIYPLYFITLVVAFVTFEYNRDKLNEIYQYFSGKEAHFTTTFDAAANPGFLDLFAHLTFLHGFFPVVNTSILGPAWSLSLEMQFYLVFPLFFLFLFKSKKTQNPKVIASIFSFMILALITPKLLGEWDVTAGTLMNFGAPSLILYKMHFFMLGIIAAWVILRRKNWTYLFVWIVFVLPLQDIITIFTTVVLLYFLFSNDLGSKGKIPLVKPITSALKTVLGNKVTKIGADISYSLYLIHMILLPFVVGLVIDMTSYDKLTTAFISLCAFLILNTIVSYALYLAIEKPFIKIGKKFIGGRIKRTLDTA